MLSTLTTNTDGSFTATYHRPRELRTDIIDSFLDWLHAGREDVIKFRTLARKKYGLKAVRLLSWFALENNARKILRVVYIGEEPLPIRVLTRAEKVGTLGALVLISSCTALSGNASPIAAIAVTPVVAQTTTIALPKPANWLDGIPESNGFRKDALSGPYEYAVASGYEFAESKERLLELVESDVLVELEESKSLKFNKVSRPYVLPVVAKFVYRLADQYYYDQKCGPLWLNGAARDIAFQQKLKNGSKKSVHPTGMSVDFKTTGIEPRCLTWLKDTLLEIEAAKRIDFTAETSPAHFHVTVATHEYEGWLAKRLEVNDSETDWLRKALFYEGGPKESIEGFRAIAWVIRNRVDSEDHPDTIQAVVAEGSAGKYNGGCQFSFMCDGKVEDRYELCRNAAGALTPYWRYKCDARWEQVTVFAKAFMSETADPTGGAVLYYTGKKPHWAKSRIEIWGDKKVELPHGDFKPGTVKEIGSHTFGCSMNRGKDVCEGGRS
jgi:spore germination cell wall hydrolase CwlJ-like protein